MHQCCEIRDMNHKINRFQRESDTYRSYMEGFDRLVMKLSRAITEHILRGRGAGRDGSDGWLERTMNYGNPWGAAITVSGSVWSGLIGIPSEQNYTDIFTYQLCSWSPGGRVSESEVGVCLVATSLIKRNVCNYRKTRSSDLRNISSDLSSTQHTPEDSSVEENFMSSSNFSSSSHLLF